MYKARYAIIGQCGQPIVRKGQMFQFSSEGVYGHCKVRVINPDGTKGQWNHGINPKKARNAIDPDYYTPSNHVRQYVAFTLTNRVLGYCLVKVFVDGSYEIKQLSNGRFVTTDKTHIVVDRVLDELRKGEKHPSIATIKGAVQNMEG